MLVSRHRNAFAALAFIGLTGMSGAALAAGPSSEFGLNGDVATPGVYTLPSLTALSVTTETANYKAGGNSVPDT